MIRNILWQICMEQSTKCQSIIPWWWKISDINPIITRCFRLTPFEQSISFRTTTTDQWWQWIFFINDNFTRKRKKNVKINYFLSWNNTNPFLRKEFEWIKYLVFIHPSTTSTCFLLISFFHDETVFKFELSFLSLTFLVDITFKGTLIFKFNEWVPVKLTFGNVWCDCKSLKLRLNDGEIIVELINSVVRLLLTEFTFEGFELLTGLVFTKLVFTELVLTELLFVVFTELVFGVDLRLLLTRFNLPFKMLFPDDGPDEGKDNDKLGVFGDRQFVFFNGEFEFELLPASELVLILFWLTFSCW